MKIFEARKVSDTLYILNESIKEGFFVIATLIIGKDKAAIIDTGYGAGGDLKDLIRSITDKPLICLLTHCDPDHAGSAALFEEIYMNSRDEVLMKNGALGKVGRLMQLKNLCDDEDKKAFIEKNILKPSSFSYYNTQEGDLFDLGGIVLETIAFPGHTAGSICFYNRNENYCVAGDAIANANSAVLFFKKCLSLHTYYDNLKGFTAKVEKDCIIYTGHDSFPLAPEIIPELLLLCEDVFAGNILDDKPYMPPFFKVAKDKSWIKRTISGFILNIVKKKQFGRSLEHKMPGFKASLKYNADKIR